MSGEIIPRALPSGTITVGGQEYPYRVVKNCQTCQSPLRDSIEHSILMGMSYKSIAESIEDMDTGEHPIPTVLSIRSHYNRGHMPIVSTAERALIEQRAKDIGRNIEHYTGSLNDYQSVNQIVIQRGMARIASGEIQPSMGDVLTAIRNQHTIEQSVGDGLDTETMQEALFTFMEVAREFIPEDQLAAYSQKLMTHPILKAITKKQSVQGEVVSDHVID